MTNAFRNALPYTTLAVLAIAAIRPEPARLVDERASFVTMLGRDTVAVESIIRSVNRIDGTAVVRMPGTVVYHYIVELNADNTISKATLDINPMEESDVLPEHAEFVSARDSLVGTATVNGQKKTVSVSRNSAPFLMLGSGPSYGLLSSLGLYEIYLPRLTTADDTTAVPVVDLATLRGGTRAFLRRSPTLVDVSYFGIAWTHLAVDGMGTISAADASETTERTQAKRVDYMDPNGVAQRFAAMDKSKKGLGIASPSAIARGTIDGQLVVATYNSPRRRGRNILGNVVPYDVVWRTGANESTTLMFDKDLKIGGTVVPGGAYSVWTIPHKDGSVDLLINRQHGQWGTDHDAAQDLLKVPMHVSTVSSPRDEFTISVNPKGDAGELQMAWDAFVWSVAIGGK
ncbi:MAG: DUF2911 domain-containing protein [Gemmatimonadota bacterium]|nr:DUF2911 domain-containing protein [Gemmatimonadota bacterium]